MNALNTLVNESNTVQTVFDVLAKRERFRRETNIDQFWSRLLKEKNGKVNRDEYFEAFKALQDAGYGALIQGRGGKPTRFAWDYDLKAVAQSTLKGQDVPEEAKLEPMLKSKSQIRTKVKIKPGVQITINLPNNIKADELQAMIEKLSAIAY